MEFFGRFSCLGSNFVHIELRRDSVLNNQLPIDTNIETPNSGRERNMPWTVGLVV